jgi:hypothetical protein
VYYETSLLYSIFRFNLVCLSRCGPIDKALELLQFKVNSDEGGVDQQQQQQLPRLCMTKYITKTFPLSKADEAIRCAAEKSTMKVQIICSSSSNNNTKNTGLES